MRKTIKERAADALLSHTGGAVLQNELMQMLGLQKSARKLIRKAVADLEDVGFLRFNRKNRMSVDRTAKWEIATCYRRADGGHLLITDDGRVMPAPAIGANADDRLLVRLIGGTCEIRDILTRKEQTYIGVYLEEDGEGFFIPEEGGQDQIRVKNAWKIGARPLDLVLCVVDENGRDGRLTEVVQTEASIEGPDIEALCEDRGVPCEFSKGVLREADSIREGEADFGRVPLPELLAFTIDGEDARDLDDAISIEASEDGYRIGVHIADVTHYVKEGGEVDNEARRRGVAVYFPDRNIPMLPRRLSDDLCSLHPGKAKRTLSVFMDFSKDGRQTGFEIQKTLIRSRARLTYEEVADFLEGEVPTLDDRAAGLDEALIHAHFLSESIRQQGFQKGKIRFGLPRTHIRFDQDLEPVLVPEHRGIAHQMIESFMVRANETVAKFIHGKGLPFLYRVHEQPRADRLERLVRFMDERGYYSDFEGATAKEFQSVMNEMKKTPHGNAAEQLLVESMIQARYHTFPEGHFGLGLSAYCHFTSPIRRYADLLCHRVVKAVIGTGPQTRQDDPITFREMADHLTGCERRAEGAEQEAETEYIRRWAQIHAGEVYTGRISQIGANSVRVLLDNGASGKIPLQDGMEAEASGFTVRFGSERLELGSKIGVRIRKEGHDGVVFSYLYREHADKTRKAWAIDKAS